MIRRFARTLSALVAVACLSAFSWAAAAQSSAAVAGNGAPRSSQARERAPTQPVAWASLSPGQQRMLAPLQDQWSRLHPARQHRLGERAARWAALPPKHQQQIRERLARWAQMTPAQRRQLRENARAFHDLSPEERVRVSAAFKKFQSLPPAQRHALRERWRAMSPEQRRQWAAEHPDGPIPARPPRQREH